MYEISQEQVRSMTKYYLSDKFEIHELPPEAWFVDLNGRLVWKKTGLHGLNRPEGVNYDKIFEAQAQGNLGGVTFARVRHGSEEARSLADAAACAGACPRAARAARQRAGGDRGPAKHGCGSFPPPHVRHDRGPGA